MKKKTEKNKIKYTDEITRTVNELLLQLQVKANVEVTEETANAADEKISTEEKEVKHFKVNISTEESGLLIGHHGETINSFQLILGVILYKKLGEWVRILVDIGDYRKMREESIKEMVNRIIAEVEQSGRAVELPYLSPLERRIVHMMLSSNEKVMSESAGEGRDRRVMIKPRFNA